MYSLIKWTPLQKLNDTSICKPWLKVEPSTGFVMPGDKVRPKCRIATTK